MLDFKFLIQNKDQVIQSLNKRGAVHLLPLLDEVVGYEGDRKAKILEVETLKAERNLASQEIAKLKKEKKEDNALMEKMKGVATKIKALDEELAQIEEKIKLALFEFPNVLANEVPEGKDAAANKVVRVWGFPPKFNFKPKSHDEIGEKMGILDFKKAGEVSGARFVFAKGLAATLERALIQFMISTHAEKGYVEMLPPFLVNRKALIGTGQLPKFEEDVFRIEKFDYFLIPTAEVPVTNYHRDEILAHKDLPIKYVAHTPCFRSEAGSYGKDTKGLKRQHQFNKVELVKFATPESSAQELEKLLNDAELILQKLNLHYRVVLLCGGDIGFGSSKTYDIEVWSPPQNGFMEISSCSNFADFQARRAGIRYRDDAGKVNFAHTLNGSGLAVGRTALAIMENFQKEDGTFEVPAVLSKYF